ncbi:MAG TPA: lipid II flippase MurJ, partial [Actinomycetota bacterium]|nr:lipid II flippase MurJ [Actinomycetota bacterium]
WTCDLRDPGLRRLVRLSGWALLYVVVNQLGLLVVIVLAASVQGGYTAYTAAFIFFQLPYAIFAVSIMTALLPSLSGLWAGGERDSFRVQLAQGVRGTAFIVVPAALGYVALAVPIVRLLLQHGVMQARSTELVAGVLQVFSVGLFSFSAFQVFLRAFYAMQDTRTPALINVVAVAINTLVNLLYFRYLRVEGLALGHATAYTFAAITSAVILRRRMGGFEGRRLGVALGQVAVGGIAAGAAAWLVARAVEATLGNVSLAAQLTQVIGGIAGGLGAFVAVALAFRMQELVLLRNLVLARLRR